MIILGVDPGTVITGYGVIEGLKTLDYGCVRPPPALPLSERYLAIFEAIDHLLEKFQPKAVVVETQFVHKNVASAMKLGMARACVILAAARRRIEIFEYAPKKAKLAVVGNGGASKEQVQKMIRMLLKLGEAPLPEDAADALALAICHAHRSQLCLSISAAS